MKPKGKRTHRVAADSKNVWVLRLYVAGQTHRSIAAFDNLHDLCETYLKGRHHIEVIDLLLHPQRCCEDQIVAIPTLVRRIPKPTRKIIGDLSNTERVLVGLQLCPERAHLRRYP